MASRALKFFIFYFLLKMELYDGLLVRSRGAPDTTCENNKALKHGETRNESTVIGKVKQQENVELPKSSQSDATWDD